MNYIYLINEKNIIDEDKIIHKVYGIDVLEASGKLYLSITDVFFDKKEAENLCIRCNNCNLSPIHIKDVIEDALTEQHIL